MKLPHICLAYEWRLTLKPFFNSVIFLNEISNKCGKCKCCLEAFLKEGQSEKEEWGKGLLMKLMAPWISGSTSLLPLETSIASLIKNTNKNKFDEFILDWPHVCMRKIQPSLQNTHTPHLPLSPSVESCWQKYRQRSHYNHVGKQILNKPGFWERIIKS